MSQQQMYMPSIADILYGSYIRYDRLFEMTKYAFYGKTDSNNVNIFIDLYSVYKGIFTRGANITINDSYVIASLSINLAIHLRAYFETRHNVHSKVYLIYGGSRPIHIMTSDLPEYNAANILMEDSNQYIRQLIADNMEVLNIMTPYLHDIFSVVDYENEFSVIVSSIIDSAEKYPNIICTKDPLAYQLVAFKPRTFIYRPKKKGNIDASWVVTKSTLYNAYRYAELGLTKQFDTKLDVKMFSIYQAISGVKSRSIKSIKNGNATIGILEDAIDRNIFFNGYNASLTMMNPDISPLQFIANSSLPVDEVIKRFRSIDLPFQTSLYQSNPSSIRASERLINLYNPQEVRNINDRYFTMYPLDLNRV